MLIYLQAKQSYHPGENTAHSVQCHSVLDTLHSDELLLQLVFKTC